MTSVPGLRVVDQECMMSKVLDDDGNLKTDNKGIAVEELVCSDIYGPAFVKAGSPDALDVKANPVLVEDKQNLTILGSSPCSTRKRSCN